MVLGKSISINQLQFSLKQSDGTVNNIIVKTEDNIKCIYVENKVRKTAIGKIVKIGCNFNVPDDGINDDIRSSVYIKLYGQDSQYGRIKYLCPSSIIDIQITETSPIIATPICTVVERDQQVILLRENESGIFQYTKDGITWKDIVGSGGGTGGKSAYEIAVDNGFVGTEIDWLLSLKGAPGTMGTDGKSAYEIAVDHGYAGTEEQWLVYIKGIDGKSAYESAVSKGYAGTEEDWLQSLNGKSSYQVAIDRGYNGTEDEWLQSLKGINAYQVAVSAGYSGTETEWLESLNGTDGKSAYQVALDNGFVGTEEEWLLSLKGSDASQIGRSAYQVAVDNGFVGTETQWLQSLKGKDGVQGIDGKSAYEIAVSEGYTGTEEEWIESLRGRDGSQGLPGLTGPKGNPGDTPVIDAETKRWFINGQDTGYVAVPSITDIPNVPVALSQLTNDENFIKNTVNNLVNYYTKDLVYNKTEITSLLGAINTISIKIVEQLPTENISNNIIYLVAVGENVYSQHIYTEGGWSNIGTTNVDLHNYVTITDMQSALSSKSDTTHTHSQLHTHDNKLILDSITQELIEKWNNNFSGNYNDLSGAPRIPTVTNDLTNELKSTYDDAVQLKHNHSNMSTLDKFSESVDGKPLYDNKTIYGNVNIDDIIDDTNKSTAKTWSSNKISEQISVIDHINVAQKTVNKRGTKELLPENVIFDINPATIAGTAVTTNINQDIILSDNIENYDLINIQLGIKSDSVFYKSNLNSISVSQIIYNSTNTYNNADGSVLFLEYSNQSGNEYAYGMRHIVLIGWFKNNSTFFLYAASNPYIETTVNKLAIFSMQGISVDSVTIDPIEYVNAEKGLEDAPVGHIINMMSITPPKHYLKCDGTIYNIADYTYLSQHIKNEFGAFNFFGGDGVTTFAVPDLRGEFLRGTGTANRNTGSGGNVGTHQDGTEFANVLSYNSDSNMTLQLRSSGNDGVISSDSDNMENITYGTQYRNYNPSSTGIDGESLPSTFTSRPTNTSVLFCIKYEPTYFMSMEGFINEVVLWKGNVGTSTATSVSNSINLNDAYTNYNKIGVFFTCTRTDGSIRPQYREIYSTQITELRGSAVSSASISFTWGYSNVVDYTDILKTSTTLRFDLSQYQSHINKIIGIRYSTSSGSTGGDDTTYTDSEIQSYVEGLLNGN